MEDGTAEIYTQIGDGGPFYALVDEFYARVEADALLRPLYPDDLTQAKQHLAWFLIQRFGGPSHYGEARGHPRLRMRHVPFRIRAEESAAWLRCMAGALDALPAFAPFRADLDRYFADTAAFMINHSEVPAVSLTE